VLYFCKTCEWICTNVNYLTFQSTFLASSILFLEPPVHRNLHSPDIPRTTDQTRQIGKGNLVGLPSVSLLKSKSWSTVTIPSLSHQHIPLCPCKQFLLLNPEGMESKVSCNSKDLMLPSLQSHSIKSHFQPQILVEGRQSSYSIKRAKSRYPPV